MMKPSNGNGYSGMEGISEVPRKRRCKTPVLVFLAFLGIVTVGVIVAVVVLASGESPEPAPYQVTAQDLLYLFDRPTEPVTSLRGLHRNVAFDVPAEYLTERNQRVAEEVAAGRNQPGVRIIPIRRLSVDTSLLDTLSVMPLRAKYLFALPIHYQVVDRFRKYFAAMESIEDFLSAAVWARCHFSPEMILDAIRLAMLDRKDTQGVQLPEITQYHPDLFVDDSFFAKVRAEMWNVQTASKRVTIPVEKETPNADETRVWFFREDVHLNLLHFHWHNQHPYQGDLKYVDVDRRGELFALFHREMLARYNANRFSVGLPRVKALNIEEPIVEGFAPKMVLLASSRSFPSRQANSVMQYITMYLFYMGIFETTLIRYSGDIPCTDVKLPTLGVPVAPLQGLKDAIAAVKEAIRQGFAIAPNGTHVPMVGVKGLDLLANLMESAPLLSPNMRLYGSIHNMLHGFIASIHDPVENFKEPVSAIAPIQNIRDPVFYRIHTFVDDLYDDYKLSLTPYERDDLVFPGVAVQSVSVESVRTHAINEFHTFWLQSDVDVARGLEYTSAGSVYAGFKHLAHEPFRYTIKVKNSNTEERRAFIRIFLLMQTDENGRDLDLGSIQRWAMQMDKFKVTLKPGLNTFERDSVETTVSIDPDRIFEKYETLEDIRANNWCRCGFPMSLLVPKGTEEGIRYTLLAMATDYDHDGIDPDEGEVCREGWVYCGAPGSQFYPDRRAMGYPFDRKLRQEVGSISEYLTENMATEQVVVKFEDSVHGPSPLLSSRLSTSWKG